MTQSKKRQLSRFPGIFIYLNLVAVFNPARMLMLVFLQVHLSPARRDYLEYKFGTIKSYNGRNRFVLPFIVRMYVSIDFLSPQF